MSDLISRSALLKCFCVTKEGRRIPEFDCDNKEVTVSIKDVKRVIRDQPTIEAVPEGEAEWEICEEPNTYDTYGNKITYARCKNCGFTWRNKHHVNNYFKHCPNCGADMRKGGTE